MNAMWKFASSSFSNSAGSKGLDACSDSPRDVISTIILRAASSSSWHPSAVVSLSSTLIFTSLATNVPSCTPEAILRTRSFSWHAGTPRAAAYRFAAAMTNSKCNSSDASNLIAAGGRLGPLQNRVPSLVLWSIGNVCMSCAMESWNLSWNSSTAKRAHMSKGPLRCSSILLMPLSRASCDVPVPSCATFFKNAAVSLRYVFTSRGLSTKSCSNRSRDHSMVCSIACGKCFRVHRGIDSSGGSWESPYDCVRYGSTTWAFALVPRVPDSSKGLANHTHRESTYSRAWMLSRALTTQSSEVQKTSSKTSSVSLPTRISIASTFRSMFITLAALAAVTDLGLPTSVCLKRNWRLRLDTSILSMSVTVILPWGPQQTPIIAKHFKYSQPSAPAPTRKSFALPTTSCRDLPMMAIWSSFLLPEGCQSWTSAISSNMSK
mmetsp:Transcript_102743/g.268167  ORF Transcript_102743/g.268167 Transcript_102743/m.268167 type:complete len:434 (+) Transcript_102743:756-2057(+)